MQTRHLTLLFLGIALIARLAVPPIREGARNLRRSCLGVSDWSIITPQVERTLARLPAGDPDLWLGYAEFASAQARYGRDSDSVPPPTPARIEAAFARAAALSPTDPAPRLRCALYHLAGVPRLGEAADVLIPRDIPAHRAAALAMLVEGRALDPENAATDYLEAALRISDDPNPDASLPLLRQALRKERWSFYEDRTARASLHFLQAAGHPLQYRAYSARYLTELDGRRSFGFLRDLARALTQAGDQSASRRGPASAIERYTMVLHAGTLMRSNAHSIIGGLVGTVLNSAPLAGFLSAAEKAALDEATSDDAERWRRRAELAGNNFVYFLRMQGRPDVAGAYLAEREAGQRFGEAARRAPKPPLSPVELAYGGGGMLLLIGMPRCLAVWLALAWGLASLLVLRGGGREEWRRPWRYPLRTWLALAAIVAAPAIIVCMGVFALVMRAAGWPPVEGSSGAVVVGWGVLVAVVCFLCWVGAVLTVALRRSTGQSAGGPVSRRRAFWSTVRALSLPTAALMVLLSTLSVWPLQAYWQRTAARDAQALIEGEVRYYGLNAPPAPPAS